MAARSPERVLERVTGPGGPAPGLRELLVAGALTLAGFAAAVRAQRAFFPDEIRMDERSRAREAIWEDRSGGIDVAFFGSSHVEVGLVPESFDATLAEHGFPLRSFNFGLGGASSFEVDWLLRRVVAVRGPRLRTVVVELPDWTPEVRNPDSLRTAAWHDGLQTRGVLWALLGRAPLLEQVRLASEHLRLFALRTGAVGIGPRAFEERLRGRDLTHLAAELAETSGYYLRPLEARFVRGRAHFLGLAERAPEARGPARRSSVRARVDELAARFEDKVAAMRDGEVAEEERRYPVELLRRQRDYLRAQGLEVVYLVPPVLRLTPWALELEQTGELPRLFRYNDPERHAELLALEVRYDDEHLTHDGAVLFSRRFAEEFAGFLAAGGSR